MGGLCHSSAICNYRTSFASTIIGDCWSQSMFLSKILPVRYCFTRISFYSQDVDVLPRLSRLSPAIVNLKPIGSHAPGPPALHDALELLKDICKLFRNSLGASRMFDFLRYTRLSNLK